MSSLIIIIIRVNNCIIKTKKPGRKFGITVILDENYTVLPALNAVKLHPILLAISLSILITTYFKAYIILFT